MASKGYAIVKSGGGGVILPETEAILNEFTGPVTWQRALEMNDLVSALVTSGIWSELDVFFMFANFDAQSSLVDWINPTTRAATLIGAPVFTADRGYNGGGVDGIDSNWNPSLSAKFTLTDNSIGAYSRDNIAAANSLLYGLTDVGNNGIFMNPSNPALLFRSCDNAPLGGISGVGVADTLALCSNKRISNAQFECYQRDALIQTVNSGTFGIFNANMYICGSNFGPGAFANGTAREVSMFFAGTAAVDIATLYTAVQAYLTAVGAAV